MTMQQCSVKTNSGTIMEDQLILVDESDHAIGFGNKLEVHRRGLLHRAFSIFVLDSQSRLMLQRRAFDKYHSGGLWSNTCCSHPRRGEECEFAVHRRLREEMGFDCNLQRVSSFKYRAEVSNGLIEHELTHIYLGSYDQDPLPDSHEVSGWKRIDIDHLYEMLETQPGDFTAWFEQMLRQPSLKKCLFTTSDQEKIAPN